MQNGQPNETYFLEMPSPVGRSHSGENLSLMAVPVFYSFVIHVSIISFILTLPVYHGSLKVFSVESLFVDLRNDDGRQTRPNDQDVLKTSIKSPRVEKTKAIADGETAESGIKSKVEELAGVTEPSKIALNTEIQSKSGAETLPKKYNVPPVEKQNSKEPLQAKLSIEEPSQENSSSIHLFSEDSSKKILLSEENRSEGEGVPRESMPAREGSAQIEIKGKMSAAHESPVSHPAGDRAMHNVEMKKEVTETEQRQHKGPKRSTVVNRTAAEGKATVRKVTEAQMRDKGYKHIAALQDSNKSSGKLVAKPVASHEKNGTAGISARQVQAELTGIIDKTIEDKKKSLGLPIEEMILKDLRIEINLNVKDVGHLSMRLLKKPYPSTGKKINKNKQDNMNCAIEEKVEDFGTLGVRHIVSVMNADSGIYTFVIDNEGSLGYKATLIFRIYEGQGRQRIKEYKMTPIQPGSVSKFKFILPDAIFWDDEDRFSGEIEDSDSVTKFNYESGLMWREDKD